MKNEIPKIPFLRPDFFLKEFTPQAKGMFWGLMAIQIVALLFLVIASFFPYQFVTETVAVPDTSSNEVTLTTAAVGVNESPVSAPLFFNLTSFSVTPINPSLWLIFLFAGFCAIAWSAILTAVCRVEGFYSYLILFIYACWLYYSDIGKVLVPFADLNMFVTMGVLSIQLIPIFLFKSKIWKLEFIYRFLVFLVIQILILFTVYQVGEKHGVFCYTTFTFPIWIIIAIFYLLLTSRDLTSVILLLTNNHPTPEKRKSPGFIALIMAILFGLELLLTLKAYNKISFDIPFIRPLYFLFFAGLFNVFTLQNTFFKVSDSIPLRINFVMLIQGTSIIVLGGLGYYAASAEFSLLAKFERLIITTYFVFGLLHAIYLFINFYSLLKERVCIFYVSMLPRVIKYTAITLTGLTILIIIEGLQKLYTLKTFRSVNQNIQADSYMLLGDLETASMLYKQSLYSAPYDPKANYNRASLLISNPNNLENNTIFAEIKTHYNNTDDLTYFPLSAINYGNFYRIGEAFEDAISHYRRVLRLNPNPVIFNNLAWTFNRIGERDSAKFYLNKCLETDPSNAIALSNLALLNHLSKNNEKSIELIEKAIELEPQNRRVLENYIFLNLVNNKPIKLNIGLRNADTLNLDLTFINNLIGYQIHSQSIPKSQETAKTQLKINESGPSIFTQMLTDGLNDSIINASRHYQWLIKSYPNFKDIAARNMSSIFERSMAPEMAFYYATQSAETGSKIGMFRAAKLLAHLGNYSEAYKSFSLIALDHPELKDKANQYLAYIDRLRNEKNDTLHWNFKDLTANQLLTMVAMAKHYPQTNLFNRYQHYFNQIKEDSIKAAFVTLWIDFLYSNKNFNEAKKKLEQLKNLKSEKLNPYLLCRIGKIGLDLEVNSAFEACLNVLVKTHETSDALKFLQAYKSLKEKDYNRVLEIISNQKFYLGNNPVMLELFCNALDKLGKHEDAFNNLVTYLEVNWRNPRIWYITAYFAQKLTLQKDVEHCLKKAAELTFNPEINKKLLSFVGNDTLTFEFPE